MAASTARHETRALLRAHLAAASGYRHLTRHCPICHRLLRLAMEPSDDAMEPSADFLQSAGGLTAANAPVAAATEPMEPTTAAGPSPSSAPPGLPGGASAAVPDTAVIAASAHGPDAPAGGARAESGSPVAP
ncbi:DUF6274 family protein [Streptomyces sp. JH14]|uniref:DUF6274 family protein n=1 Tax=Streptomyces sp. JH14 TaxID=2793630 RepID=UPI0023F82899|nr:DUF6274 family protein [Streptomyces sp. JH14]MDF6043414.1 DUF6274 family protein [Streptomyces sp. JH14]